MPTIRDALIDLGDDLKPVRLAPASAVRTRGDQRRRRQHAGAIITTTAVASAVTVIAVGVPTGRFAAPSALPSPTCAPVAQYSMPEPRQKDSAMMIQFWSGTPDADVVARLRAIPGVRAITAASPEQVAAWTTYEYECPASTIKETPATLDGMLVVEYDRTHFDEVSANMDHIMNGRPRVILDQPSTTEPAWCNGFTLNEYTAFVRVAPEATAEQRDAIEAALRNEWQVASAVFDPNDGGESVALPDCAHLAGLGPYFALTLKTNFGYAEVRDAIATMPGVAGFVAPNTEIR
jgi:hypothetical protein